jgi:hypothetical protein
LVSDQGTKLTSRLSPSKLTVLNDEEFFDALEIGLDQLDAEAEAAHSLDMEETVAEV